MNDEKKDGGSVVAKKVEVVKVTSRASIDFPGLEWGINAGEVRDLPSDKEAQKTILASEFIKPVN